MKGIAKLAGLLASLALLSPLFAAKKELNLFAWSEYVPQEVIDGFSEETGIRVNYEVFASGEEMLAKLLAGGTAYDIIQPPDYIAEALIKARLLAPLDYDKLPNFKHILPEYLKMPHDPTQAFTVPYMSGTVGIVVNTEVVKDPVKGFKDVFQARHANRIVVVNDNRELVTWALYTLGIGANDLTAENLEKAKPLLRQWVKLIKVYDSDSPKTALLGGEVDLGVVWSGEAAMLHNEDKKFAYVLPEEGAHQFVDLLAIPASAENKDAAHQFINYVLRPEVSKLVSDAFPYTNPNREARKLLTEEQRANPASYPPVGKMETFRHIGKTAEQIDEMVTDLKNTR
jgi:spermidine/putrescine transport system substrate-binding protein